jgi:putative transposase
MTQSNSRQHRQRWALLRLEVIGHLLASPPADGALQAALTALAQSTWRHPLTGADLRFGFSTIERWYLLARKQPDPVARLTAQGRTDAGAQRAISVEVAAAIRAQYARSPEWTVQLHYDNLKVDSVAKAVPSYPTVRRFFAAQGLHRVVPDRSKPLGALKPSGPNEIRSYEATHVGSMFHLDGHLCSIPVLLRSGEWIQPLGIGVIDDHSRLIAHLQWYVSSENTECLVHCFSQAVQRRGLPRLLHNDNGSAMIAGEFAQGLDRLGIAYRRIQAGKPWQNGKQEKLWDRVEERLIAMLKAEPNLSLERLNLATYAWTEFEYQTSVHRELNGATPLQRFSSAASVLRASPGSEDLRRAFRIEITRQQRLSDGTVSIDGRRFEVPQAFAHLRQLHLRYARWDLSQADVVDARDGTILATIHPLDKARNADGRRKARVTIDPSILGAPQTPADGQPAPLLRKLLAQFAATGLPVAMIHHEQPNPEATP